MAVTATLYQNNLQNIHDHNSVVDQTQYSTTFFCRALYDYQSRDASSLSFRKGDIIEVLTQLDSGWWDGLLHDERGWFPSNYVASISVQELEEELRTTNVEQQEEDWMRDGRVMPPGLPNDFWMPEVAADGRIFYVNTQTGERSSELPTEVEHDSEPLVSNMYALQNAPTTNTTRDTRQGSTQETLAGFGIPRRSGTPEPWVKRLADDGMSYYYLNTIDKSVRWTPPSPQLDRPANNALDPLLLSSERLGASSAINEDGLSIYSDDSDNNPLGILGRTHTDSVATAVAPTIGWHQGDVPGSLQARQLQELLQNRFAPPPESLNDLAQASRVAVSDLLESVLSRNNGLHIKEGITRTTDAIRDLVYASEILTGSLSSLPLPYNVSTPSADVSELKQYHRKVSANMVKLISAVRAVDADRPLDEDLSTRFEAEANELRQAITTFVDEVLRRRSSRERTRRIRGVLLSADGSKGVGLSLYGAGSAGRWKGFGFVEPMDGEILSSGVLATVKQKKTRLDDALVQLEMLSNSEQPAIIQGQEVIQQIVLFLDSVSGINVARSVDVDSNSTAVADSSYLQSVTRAQGLVRALEAGVQAIFDDGVVLLESSQSGVQDLTLPTATQPSWTDLLPVTHSLRSNSAEVFTTLEVLVETALYQDDACAKAGLDRAIGIRNAWLRAHDDNNREPLRDTAQAGSLKLIDLRSTGDDGEMIDLGDAFSVRPSTRDRERAIGVSRHGQSDTSIDRLYNSVKGDARGRGRSQTGSTSSMDKDVAMSRSSTLVSTKTPPPDYYDIDDDELLVGLGAKSPPKAHKIKAILGADAPDAYIKMANADSKPWYLRAEYGAKDIFINPDGGVRGGTLPALIERLTMHDNRDANFNNTFLLTLKSFTTLDEVFDSLVKRFSIQPPAKLTPEELKEWTEQKQVVVRLRVINILKAIVMDEDVLEKEDSHILDRIKAFASTVEKEIVPPLPAVKQLLVLVERAQSGGDAMVKMTQHTPNYPPPSIVPKTSKPMKLLDIDPLELARQLTIMESKLFAKIRPMECLNRGRDGKPGDSDDNISAIIDTSNKVAEWVADAVLSKDDSRKRATIVKQFIAVADRCRHLQNFSTMAALVAGLNSPPIRRLKRTWEQVNARSKAQLQEAERTMDTNKNFTNYRAVLKQAQLPCVPFFGVYLSVLTFIQDGNKNMIQGDMINFSKREKFAEVIREIKHYQSKPYNLHIIAPIQNYIDDSLSALGNTADLSDRAWNLSLEREPREREDEKMARLLQESGFL